MYKLLIITTLSLLALVAMTGSSNAVIKVVLRPEQFDDAYKNAVFVGKVEVIAKDDHGPVPARFKNCRDLGLCPSAYTLKPVQSYKTPYDKNMVVYDICCYSSKRSMPPVGTIYEEMINDLNGELVHSVEIPEEAWFRYRKSAVPSTVLNEKEKACRQANGEWRTEKSGFFNIDICRYLTKDGDKKCSDSSQCERFCFADISDEEKRAIDRTQITAGEGTPMLHKFGKCGKYKNADGCHNFVESGTVGKTECIGQGYYK